MLTETTPLDRYRAGIDGDTAVERFSREHDAGGVALLGGRYRDLVPLTAPGPGQQYAFEVDLDTCTGCKACVAACHSLNGLDDDEVWRSVGLLVGGSPEAPVQQTVTTACHHCVEPACLAGCPVDAYEKDPLTGIVSHLDDQCIGCGYCTLTCPYEVPVYNPARGIVRKCDLCRDRLAEGEAPACAQACPTSAIRVTVVDTAAVVEAAAGASLVPGAPASSITVPTTTYRTRRPLAPDLRAADHFSLRPARAHPPLAVMLVLTQLAVGAVLADLVLRPGGQGGPGPSALGRADALVAVLAGVVALAASVLHLGRPRACLRAVIGLRHSWLSREIVAFGAFAGLATVYAAAVWLLPASSTRGLAVLGALVAGVGLAGVACSVMIYAVTGRVWWRASATATRFGLTTVGSGLAVVLVTSTWSAWLTGSAPAGGAVVDLVRPLALALAGVTVVKLAWEASIFRHLRRPGSSDLARTARLLAGDLATATTWRFVLGLAGGVAVPLVMAGAVPTGAAVPVGAAVATAAGLAALVAGELVERSLFFRAVTAPRMPGSLP